MYTQNIYPTGYQREEALAARPSADELGLLGSDGSFSFGDILDAINPIQHIPVVGSLYRSLTGDTLPTGASLASGFFMGGPVGLLAAAINVGLESATGEDVTGHMFAMVTGENSQQYAMNAYKKANALT